MINNYTKRLVISCLMQVTDIISRLSGIARSEKNLRMSYDAKREAVELIQRGKATCVTVKDNRITTMSSSRGIAYIIDLYERSELEGAFVADKVVGKAAAMVFTMGGISGCYAENISDGAIAQLEGNSIPLQYKNRSEYIVNRTGDGMCPMEQTVANIYDEHQALEALKIRVAQLQNQTENKDN